MDHGPNMACEAKGFCLCPCSHPFPDQGKPVCSCVFAATASPCFQPVGSCAGAGQLLAVFGLQPEGGSKGK